MEGNISGRAAGVNLVVDCGGVNRLNESRFRGLLLELGTGGEMEIVIGTGGT